MDNILTQLEKLSTNNEVLLGIVIVGVLLILLMLMSIINSKKVKKQLIEAETSYNALKSIPLPFKLNKAVALSRVNKSVAENVEKSRNDFDRVQEQLKECSVLLGEIDDLIYVHKTKQAKRQLADLSQLLGKTGGEVDALSSCLDEILEQESVQREQINKFKNQFRIDKETIREKRDSYNLGIEVLENRIADIEKMFSTFEEWMFASEFAKAGQQQIEISEAIAELENLMAHYPALYEEARVNLPKAIDETSYLYAQARNKGIYLESLEVHRNLETIANTLKDDLNRLSNGQIENVMTSLLESKTRLGQLKEQITREERAYDELEKKGEPLFIQIHHMEDQIVKIKALHERVKERFGFENWTDELNAVDEKFKSIVEARNELTAMAESNDVLATTLLFALTDLSQASESLNETLDKMKKRLDTACADEERAKKQLLKLQLIVNEISVKINKHRLPSVSLKYEEDLKKANSMINEIMHLLEANPLNVDQLNEKIKEAIDFIYVLFNSVNNLVGMAIMVENAIVFGNRYRSTYPEIDSELTRAELCFRNGQYTKALKIAISTIEKLHPGSYEKLIRKTQTQNATA